MTKKDKVQKYYVDKIIFESKVKSGAEEDFVPVRYKVVKCGDVVEVYAYNRKGAKRGKKEREEWEEKEEEEGVLEEVRTEEQEQQRLVYREQYLASSRMNIRRMALANFSAKDSLFITFTYADYYRVEVDDISKSHGWFNDFIGRVRRKYKDWDLKYLVVVEAQQDGTLHYHGLFNRVFWDYNELMELWGYGGVYLRKIQDVDNVGAYITSYMTKEMLDKGKTYLRSRNLVAPKVMVVDSFPDFLQDIKPVYSKDWDTMMDGKCLYQEYNLSRINKE